MAVQGKRWVYTLNNYTDADVEKWKQWDIAYGVVGKEKGDVKQTPHLQGFFIFKKNIWLSGLKKLDARAHWERANSKKNEPCAEYCKKEGDYQEKGELPVKATKTKEDKQQERELRWLEALDSAKNGELDKIDAELMVKYYGNLRQIAKDYMKKKEDLEAPTGIWIYGKPGVGKSRAARQMAPDAYIKMQNKWWDGYQYEDDVILDDFDSPALSHHLKIWADQYAFTAEVKGSAINIRPKRFIITSNYKPSEMGWDAITTEAIERRFKMFTIEKRYGDLQEACSTQEASEPEEESDVGDSGSDGSSQSVQQGEVVYDSFEEECRSASSEETCSTEAEAFADSPEIAEARDWWVQPVDSTVRSGDLWPFDEEEDRSDDSGSDSVSLSEYRTVRQ